MSSPITINGKLYNIGGRFFQDVEDMLDYLHSNEEIIVFTALSPCNRYVIRIGRMEGSNDAEYTLERISRRGNMIKLHHSWSILQNEHRINRPYPWKLQSVHLRVSGVLLAIGRFSFKLN